MQKIISNEAYVRSVDGGCRGFYYEDNRPTTLEIVVALKLPPYSSLPQKLMNGLVRLSYCEIGIEEEPAKIKELEDKVAELEARLKKAVAALTK
jgi:hypothetical protein